MLVKQFYQCCNFAASGLRVLMRATMGTGKDGRCTKIAVYAFFTGLVALAAVVSYNDAVGTAVADMRNVISAVAIAFMQQ